MSRSDPFDGRSTSLSISAATVADAAVAAVCAEADARDLAQEVRGVDSLDERAWQGLLETAFNAAGLHPLREIRLPKRANEPVRSAGSRCDFVLRPIDRPLGHDAEALAAVEEPPSLFDDPDAPPPPLPLVPEEVFWLELKTGSACRDAGDTGDLASLPKRVKIDLARLAHDEAIHHAAVLVIVFGVDESTLVASAIALDHHAAADGLPTQGVVIRTAPISDRHGNDTALIAVYPVGRV
ncbi:MAG: hypothetical protein OSA40_06180 [Phycisphaerales bacterium]|nr:hypothetical protein [Phycisphaerales bacterium]